MEMHCEITDRKHVYKYTVFERSTWFNQSINSRLNSFIVFVGKQTQSVRYPFVRAIQLITLEMSNMCITYGEDHIFQPRVD